jgi:hypothetical protein
MTVHCALGTVAKQTNAHKFMVVYCPYVSGTHATILRKVRYKGWIHRDITKIFKPMHSYKILNFKNTSVFLKLSNLYLFSIYFKNTYI